MYHLILNKLYISAYYFIEHNDDNIDRVQSLPHIESLMKEFRTHRCAIDFDGAFLNVEIRRKTSSIVVAFVWVCLESTGRGDMVMAMTFGRNCTGFYLKE